MGVKTRMDICIDYAMVEFMHFQQKLENETGIFISFSTAPCVDYDVGFPDTDILNGSFVILEEYFTILGKTLGILDILEKYEQF